MQARPTPRIRCSLVLLLLGLLITFLLFLFYFLFISPNSQPSSLREKGPFASLACLPASTPTDLIPCFSVANLIFYSFPAFKPIHCAGWVISFSLPFIDAGLIKERTVAMGKPHCNRSIRTFWFCNHAFVNLARDSMLVLPSVKFRVLPWLMLPLVFDSVAKPSHCAGWVAFS